jgi:hypothetical protein
MTQRHYASPQQQINRVSEEIRTRKLLVMVIANTMVAIGAMIILTGAPNFLEDWFSPWSRYLVGGVPFVAGMVVAVAGAPNGTGRISWFIQVIGLILIVAWCLALGAVYVGYVGSEGGAHLAGLGEPLAAPSTGRAYVPIVYLGLTAIVAVPLVTMLRLGPPSRR